MGDGVERRHAGGPVHDRPGDRQAEIDDPGRGRDLGGARHRLLRTVGRLHAEKLHPADPQHGQHGDGHDDDTDAAQPLQHGPPKQQPGRRLVETDDDRRSGGRETGHRLEEGIGIGQVEFGEFQRQRREQGQHDPAQRRHDESLAHREPGNGHAVGQDQRDADEQGQAGRGPEHLPVGMAGRQIDQGRDAHGDGEDAQQHPDDEQHGPEINHAASVPGSPQQDVADHVTASVARGQEGREFSRRET